MPPISKNPMTPETYCPAFRWVGQAFSGCDRCGNPYWNHTHEEKTRHEHIYITDQRRQTIKAQWSRK